MKSSCLQPLLTEEYDHFILPFLWLRGEEEAVLRDEIAKIDACGIKALCLESRPHPDFCGPSWWHDLDIVMQEAKARNMKIWILDDSHFPTGYANGLLAEKYPELARQYVMLQYVDVTGPMPCAQLDVAQLMTKKISFADLGVPKESPLREHTQLLGVTAVRTDREDILTDTVIDLTGQVADGILTFDVPAGVWRICVSFTTYDFGAKNNYINYIDKDSVHVLIEAVYERHFEHCGEEFGKTIAGFFSDEPGIYNTPGFSMDESIGRRMMPLPWNRQLPQRMQDALGKDWIQQLPLLWFDTIQPDAAPYVRYTYMDIVSRLYQENFSDQLGDWCRQHHVEYIGHVIEDENQHSRLGCGPLHYFRAMDGQDMAGIDNIGSQLVPGNPDATRQGWAHPVYGEFYHYAIAKMGASAAAIDPKKKGRLVCETYGAYGWGLGVKNMKWITDHLLLQGVNHLVPHAFSMADYPDGDCPPHFYARGHNPEYPWFTELMKYANRMCALFNGGQNVPAAAILYHGELEWMEDCMLMQKPARQLLEHQIDFEFIPMDVLTDPKTYGTQLGPDGLTVNKRTMKILIIPECTRIPLALAKILYENPQLPLVFVNRTPAHVIGDAEDAALCRTLEAYLRSCETVSLDTLASYLRVRRICDAVPDSPQKHLGIYHYKKDDEDIYFLFNTDLGETIQTTVRFPMQTYAVRYDGEKNTVQTIAQTRTDTGIAIPLTLRPYESAILVFCRDAAPAKPVSCVYSDTDISGEWALTLTPAGPDSLPGETCALPRLQPVNLTQPDFCGLMHYEKTVELAPAQNERLFLRAEHIYECAELFVNGISAGKRLTPDYEWEITHLCRTGENIIRICVVNTPARDARRYPGPLGPDRAVLEPSGMFGTVSIRCLKEQP